MQNTPTPKNVPPPVPIPEEDFDDYLEWTPEEEEAFLSILDESEDSRSDK